MSRMILSISLSLTLVIFAGLASARAQGPETFNYETKMGTVNFAHKAHQQYADCTTCHHTGDYASCTSCHGVSESAPQPRDAYHQLCKDCHQKQQAGPVKCAECHIR